MPASRKLSVILAADAVGYSRLAESDEQAALAAVRWFRERAAQIVADHGGHQFARAGDGVMAEFPTARAGVAAALELIGVVRARLAHADKPTLPIRVGVHLGDVDQESDGDRLGHGVNVAARIQQIAEPGEVLVSLALAEAARRDVEAHFERVGKERAKNLSEPIEVFRIVATSGSSSRATRRRLIVIAAGVATAALIAVGLGVVASRLGRGDPVAAVAAPAGEETASIAVLPFTDMSPERDQDYFSDGVSEEILNRLAQLQGLRVIARTSSFAFKDQNTDVRTIAAALSVGHVLEGSVRKDGDRLRITAQLIDAATGAHLWSKTYDRELTDIFAVQDEIAVSVADAMSVTFGLAPARSEVGGTTDLAAYESYLRGEAALAEAPFGGAAMDAFERAVEIDPEFALAWTAIAEAVGYARVADPANVERYTQMRREATARALALAPDLPEAHLAAMILNLDERDWAGAEAEALEISRLAPGSDAELSSVVYLVSVGRVQENYPYGEAWLQRDPLSLVTSSRVAIMYFWAGDLDASFAEYARGLGLEGDHASWAYDHLWRLMIGGDIEAIDAYLAQGTFPPLLDGEAVLAPQRLRQVLRSPAEAIAQVQAWRMDPRFAGPDRLAILAYLAAYFGDPELAVEFLREVYFERGGPLPELMWNPLLADARATEGFKDIVRELGLVDYWRESGTWGDYCRPAGADDFECS